MSTPTSMSRRDPHSSWTMMLTSQALSSGHHGNGTIHLKSVQRDKKTDFEKTVGDIMFLYLVYDVSRWNFWTEGKDIGFGIFRRTSDQRQKAGDMEEVVASKRVNSHMIPEYGDIKCDVTGTCMLSLTVNRFG